MDSTLCKTCSITVRTVTTIGDKDGPGSFVSQPSDVRIDSRGQIWAMAFPNPPQIFDTTGKFLRAAGRLGQGPGEFSEATFAHFYGDSVLMWDVRQHRASILTSDLRFVRSTPIPNSLVQVVVVGRSLVASGVLPTPTGVGYPVHIMSLGPRIEVKKSTAPDSALRYAERLYEWPIASGARNTFWSADLDQYRLINWAENGNVLAQYLRRPPWFRDKSTALPGGTQTPPNPRIVSLREDERGYLWVATWVAGKNWREAWTGAIPDPASASRRMEARRGPDLSKLYDTMVEVIDPSRGRVVAQTLVEGLLISLLSGDRAATYFDDENDIPRVKILRFQLFLGR